MFAVVLGHVLVNNGILSMNGFLWHIPGFLIISGYFGVSFSLAKVLRLLGVVYGCYWLTIPFRWGEDSLLSLLLPHGGWFLPFYLVLMLTSPIFNSALKDISARKKILGVVLLMLFAGWIPTVTSNPHLNKLKVPGFQGSGFLLMAGTYFIGRWMRDAHIAERLPIWFWLALFTVGVLCMAMPFGGELLSNGYPSPLAIATAICGFSVFLNLPDLGMAGNVINRISPSMFSVYLLHECCIKKYQYSDAWFAKFDGGGGAY